MTKKDKQFDDALWDAFSKEDHFDELRYKILRVKEIMGNAHKSFSLMPVKEQVGYCVTIATIATQTVTKTIRQLRIGGNKKEVFKYSLDEGYEEPQQIKIIERILLDNKSDEPCE